MGFELAPDPGDRGEPDVKLGRTGGSAVGEDRRLVANGVQVLARGALVCPACSLPISPAPQLRPREALAAGTATTRRPRSSSCARTSSTPGNERRRWSRGSSWSADGTTGIVWFVATCGFATIRRCARARAPRHVVPSSASTTGCCTAATPRARGPSSCSSASPTSTASCASAARRPRDPPRPAGARARRARRARSAPTAIHVDPGREPVRAPARRARPRRARRRRDRAPFPRGAERGRRARDRDRRRASRTRSSRPFTASGSQAPRREVLEAPRELPPLPSRLAKGRIPSLESLGLAQEVSDPAPRRRGRGAAGARPLPRRPVRDYTDDHDALGRDRTSRLSPYLHFGCLSVRAIEERLPPRRRARGVSPPALLARLPPPRPAPLPPQRALGVPGPLPRLDPLELRRAGRSRPGARGGPATRWSTPACASCGARAGCTTAPGSSSARF